MAASRVRAGWAFQSESLTWGTHPPGTTRALRTGAAATLHTAGLLGRGPARGCVTLRHQAGRRLSQSPRPLLRCVTPCPLPSWPGPAALGPDGDGALPPRSRPALAVWCPPAPGTCDWHRELCTGSPVAGGPRAPGQHPSQLHCYHGRSSGRPGCCLGTPSERECPLPAGHGPRPLWNRLQRPHVQQPAQGGQLRAQLGAPQGASSRPSARPVSGTPSRWGCAETAQEACLLTTISEGLPGPGAGWVPTERAGAWPSAHPPRQPRGPRPESGQGWAGTWGLVEGDSESLPAARRRKGARDQGPPEDTGQEQEHFLGELLCKVDGSQLAMPSGCPGRCEKQPVCRPGAGVERGRRGWARWGAELREPGSGTLCERCVPGGISSWHFPSGWGCRTP